MKTSLLMEHYFLYYLYDKTRHSLIYVCVAYSWPNGWTDWADIFCGHSWKAGGFIFVFPQAMPGPSTSIL